MKVSFIIPAYNAQDCIEKCLVSILEQPFPDFEVIVINDGSTDSTQSILNAFAAKDDRIRVFSQENAGQGAARTFGITQARGEYIWFVDSDDWILPSVLSRLSRILDQQTPDVLLVNFEFVYDGHPAVPSSLVPSHMSGTLINPTDDVSVFAAVSCWNTPPWRLISKRAHLLEHGITFAQGVFYEDHPFAIHLMLTAKRVYVDGGISYAYYQRATSTTKTNDQKAFDFLTIRKQCLELFKRFGQYDALAPVVSTYILPVNFYQAHVAEEYRHAFLSRLKNDLDPADVDFARQHGDWVVQAFGQAAQAGDPALMEQAYKLHAFKSRYSAAGAKRFFQRVRASLSHRLMANIVRLKQIILSRQSHAGVDTSGRRFLQAGEGVRLEPLYIDVRVKIEDRPYVTVGDYSHIGGTFVFERGLGSITIGSKSSIGGGCKIICTQEQGIHIGNNVMLSWDCTLMDSDAHSLNPDVRANDAYDWKVGVDANRMGAYKDWSQVACAPIHIEDNAWIGFETAILKGVRIGKGAVIGARSMVTKNVPAYCIFAGSPARFVSLVPREHWEWEEIIHALQADPSSRQMLEDSYLSADLFASLIRFRDSEEFRSTLAEIKQRAPDAKTILDIGGAGGVMSVALALEGYHVTLAEPSGDTIAGVQGARNLSQVANELLDSTVMTRVDIRQATIEQFHPTGSYDIVYCRQVVHHFHDPVMALKKVRSLLSEKGVAMFVREHVIFDDEDKERFLEGHALQKYTGGENAYTAEEYCAFIEAAGMRLAKQYAFKESPINFYPHSQEAALLLDESSISGRPYSFIAVNKESA
ncbi:glycosyltransferase [Pseudomonas arcuscaelestis]|uniref:glycosyltransferase n=1 Tax=Pseudomonas arcuscaelestis TaxID=2710591 RepID=UPI00193CEAC7|nr:glycosyltransferase [Pseudomonas arcuscaelestis]MBM3111569.1 glycosyltransferase [Pseudomonas arcuscaelestis]